MERGSARQTIFLERTREGHRQSDEHWNRFKGDVGETSERDGVERLVCDVYFVFVLFRWQSAKPHDYWNRFKSK